MTAQSNTLTHSHVSIAVQKNVREKTFILKKTMVDLSSHINSLEFVNVYQKLILRLGLRLRLRLELGLRLRR